MNGRTKRVLAVLLALTLLAGLFFVITLRTTHKNENRQIETHLYGYRLDGTMIVQESSGRLWEIPYTERITDSDTVLLDVTGYEVNKVYVEIVAEPETVD